MHARRRRACGSPSPKVRHFRRKPSAFAIDDAAAAQVVRAELDLDAVAGQDANAVAAHLAGGVAERLVAVVEGDAIHAVAIRLQHLALHLDLLFLLRYRGTPSVLSYSCKRRWRAAHRRARALRRKQ